MQQQAYEADLIIAEVLKHRVLQKHLGTRKLLGEMQIFLDSHSFQIGSDALFTLLSARNLLVKNVKEKAALPRFPNIFTGNIPIS